jgi:CubicO group peptidase (beta-lactamase class C family)
MATSLNLMNMLSSSSIQLTDLVSKYIENYDTNKKGNTTIANLLLHSAGLPTDFVGTLPNT